MAEPDLTLAQVHADLSGRFKHDDRLRAVEIDVAALKSMPDDMRRMEDRIVTQSRQDKAEIMAAIEANRPKSPWPAVGALAGALAVILTVAASLYGG